MSTVFPEPLFEYWVGLSPGAFSVNDLSNQIDIRQIYVDMCEKLVFKGVLDRYKDRRGWYIPKQAELIELDFKKAEVKPVDIWLPFNLSDLVEIHPGNIIIFSGIPNSGKSAMFYNIIYENQEKGWDIHLFNSESGAGELKKRLNKFPHRAIEDWNFKAWQRSGRFADVIKQGENSLNVIDFLEVHDEFYIVGKRIKEIHDRLNGAIAIIGLQKNPGRDTGLGGYRMLEVTRLAVALESGTVKIIKAKNFKRPDINPNGLSKDFNIIDGYQIIDRHGWYRQKDKKHDTD